MFKNKLKLSALVFNVLLNVLVLKLIYLPSFTEAISQATHARHHVEIQKLKSELKTDLESHNSEEVSPKGVITQPVWTQKVEDTDYKQNTQVKVTPQSQQEAAALRTEISQAVIKDKYAISDVTKTEDVKKLQASLTAKDKNQELLTTMEGVTIDSPQSEQLGSIAKAESDLSTPNVITSNIVDDAEIDIRRLQSLELNKRRSREVLILKYIEEDFTFQLGHGVHQWKHMHHADQEYFIGRRDTDILIINPDFQPPKYDKVWVADMSHAINHLDIYTYWNLDKRYHESLVLIASDDKVLWYRFNQESQELELHWDWLIGHSITGLNYFNLDTKDYLFICSNQSSNNLNIYQFQLAKKEFWINQRLQLENPCNEVTVLDTGRDVILAVAQNNTALIYSFNPHEAMSDQVYFQPKQTIPSDGILTIAGFKMGGRSYLALTGYQPQILLYQQGDFIAKTILDSNFGLVELFFPIPVRTYRDDLLLMVQHKVDFATHSVTVVDILIWDGEAFETSIPVPCHMGQHVIYGATCLLDSHRNEGLKGAALLKTGDNVTLLVPRYEAESGLFHFHTELLAKNSDLLDLQEIFTFLKEWVQEQDQLVQQAEAFLQMPDNIFIPKAEDSIALETLKTPEFIFSGEVQEIYVNDYKWLKQDSDIDLALIIQNVEELAQALNSSRQRRNLNEVYHENLYFDNVWADELEVETVNGQTFFIQNGELQFRGPVEFTELEISNQTKNFEKRQLDKQDFVLEGDLEFDTINGIKWSDIKENLVFRTQQQNFEELEVEGEVIVENILNINTLNGLNFPEDYLLSTGPSSSIVQAGKHFMNTLKAGTVVTDGLINGKNTLDAITLMDEQQWHGMPTFKKLEVRETLELHGQAWGRNLDYLPYNPTLKETNILEASCHFNELYVNGSVVLRGDLDNHSLGLLLKDVLLKPANPLNEIVVPSKKSFNMVWFPLDFHLESNTINKIPSDHFVTVQTKQNLNISSLEGYVYFYNLSLKGSYDNIKIEELLKQVIMLDKPLDLSSTEFIYSGDLLANNINVKEKLNNQTIKNNLHTLQEDLVLTSAEFEELKAIQADFKQDILGSGYLNNIELHEFIQDNEWHEPPPIRGNVFLKELILLQGLQAEELHGIKTAYLYDFLKQLNDLPSMVLKGQIQLDHIIITGDVQLNMLNNLNFDEDIQLTAIWLNKPNYLNTELSFKNRLTMNGPLNVLGMYRGINLPDLIDDIVVRNLTSCLDIKAPKSFLKPVKVFNNTFTKAINGLPLENIAWRTKANHFKGSVVIKGNLLVRNIQIQGNINDFNWQNIKNLIYFDNQLQKFVLKGVVQFNKTLYLDDLTVLQEFNGLKNISDFFEHLVHKNNLCLLKGENIFTGRVTIERGAYIKNLNGHDLVQLFNNLVFIHGNQPVVIQAKVIFEEPVKANEIQVKKTMALKTLSGCSIRDWLNDTLRVDRDENIKDYLQFTAGSIDGNSLTVKFMQDIDMSRVLTIHTKQSFNETVKFSNVYLQGFIETKGQINGKDLMQEYNNTLMTHGQQHIHTPLNIQTIIVLKDLMVKGLVNGHKNLSDVITLQEDIYLESPVFFQSLSTPQVFVKDLITGLDLDKWLMQTVKNYNTMPLYINDNWSAKNLKVLNGPTEFQYMINGYEPSEYYAYIRSARINDDNDDTEEFKDICHLIKQIRLQLFNKSQKIKYIEELSDRDLKPDSNVSIRKVFSLKVANETVLLINFPCESQMYKWHKKLNKFAYLDRFASGPIDEIEILNSQTQELNFITSYSSTETVNCSFKALNMWSIMEGNIKLKQSFSERSCSRIYTTLGMNKSLWCLNNTSLKEYDLETFQLKKSWQLTNEGNTTAYRFITLPKQVQVLLTNGDHMLILNPALNNKTLRQPFNLVRPTTAFTEHQQSNNFHSLLKPNNKLSFYNISYDFNTAIERILIDLNERLHYQVKITQLSIPETDLFDEHLIPDFINLMQELQQQTVIPLDIWSINFQAMATPATPAQVLAARVTQLSWPVVKEMEQLHFYLGTNETHDHRVCSNVKTELAYLIKEVLLQANNLNKTQGEKDHNVILNKVIETIRKFEKNLQTVIQTLAQNPERVNVTQTLKNKAYQTQGFDLFNLTKDLFMLKNNSFLPGYQQGEIINLEVGSPKRPVHLWAVTFTDQPQEQQQNTPGIYIYLQAYQKYLYQHIPSLKTHSLQQLRVKHQTLLMYIENGCQVKILKYQGSEGFVHMAEINQTEPITQLLTLDLPADSKSLKRKYLLVMVMKNQLKFYEFVMEGVNIELEIPFYCL
ncbi:hypothetical protein DOY81_000741 [Sarcophaga bullata]|nr:hypothetical protein DOY81_000741 [Sarcophaga bullata]